jgi:hypothetical protein
MKILRCHFHNFNPKTKYGKRGDTNVNNQMSTKDVSFTLQAIKTSIFLRELGFFPSMELPNEQIK